MSQEIVIGMVRFSPGCNVKRTAIAAAIGSSLLVQALLSFARRPSFANGSHTSSPLAGKKVV